MSARQTFPYAIAATALILFIVGSLRSFITGKRWYMAGIEMLIVGIVASAVAYMIGAFLSGIVH
jgi:VIT1/CCC1 family predicted Fe2+/Mn2+ transporter